MSRIAIFYPLALFCISFAFVQANRDIFCKIQKAIVKDRAHSSDDEENTGSHTFATGEVNLHKTVDANGDTLHYDIEDGSGVRSPNFKIFPHRIVVTQEAISIRYSWLTIILTPEGGSYELYRNIFPHESFIRHFFVKGTFDTVKKFNKVFVKLLDHNVGGDWVFMALNNDTPRLIFPGSLVDVDPLVDENAATKLIADLHADKDIPITIELDDPTQFHELFKMMNQVWIR